MTTIRHPGERVSIAVSGYSAVNNLCQDPKRGYFAWGRVLQFIPPHQEGDHAIVLIGLDDSRVVWREAVYVRDQWYYYNEADWDAHQARIRRAMLEDDE